MKKLFLALGVIFATALLAQDLHVINDYKTAIEAARKSHKPVMLVMKKHGCKYCEKLAKETLSDKSVIEKLNKNFVTITIFADDPQQCMPYNIAVYTRGFPTIWFLDEKGTPLFQPIGGYIDAKSMNDALDTVKKAYKEYKKGQK